MVVTTSFLQWTPGYEDIGTYNVRVFATDAGGLTDYDDVRIQVNAPPTVSCEPLFYAYEGETLRFTVHASDPNDDELLWECYVPSGGAQGSLPNGAAFDPVTREFTWTPTHSQSGHFYITFKAHDSLSSASNTTEIVVNCAPEIQYTNDMAWFYGVNEMGTIQIPFVADDPNYDEVTYEIRDMPPGAYMDWVSSTYRVYYNHQYYNVQVYCPAMIWTPYVNQSGTYTVNLTASDGHFVASQLATFTVRDTVYAYPPEIEPIDDMYAKAGSRLYLDVAVNDPEWPEYFTYDVDWNASTPEIDQAPMYGGYDYYNRFIWYPMNEDVGTYDVRIIVTDHWGFTDYEDLRITVTGSPEAHVDVDYYEVNPGQPVQFTLTATDPENDPITWITRNEQNCVVLVGRNQPDSCRGDLLPCHRCLLVDPGSVTIGHLPHRVPGSRWRA